MSQLDSVEQAFDELGEEYFIERYKFITSGDYYSLSGGNYIDLYDTNKKYLLSKENNYQEVKGEADTAKAPTFSIVPPTGENLSNKYIYLAIILFISYLLIIRYRKTKKKQ